MPSSIPITRLCIMPFILATSILYSQRTVYWKGGTIGQATKWNCPKNWQGGHVPDEFSNVVIPDVSTGSMAFPILQDEVEINALRLEGNATLTILPKGQLTVFTQIVNSHRENLRVSGILKVLNNGGNLKNSTVLLSVY